MTIQDLPTPALLLERETLDRNIGRMAAFVAAAGKALRPHFKAHKCIPIAQRQLAAGAVGICAATVDEAELLVASGIHTVLLTSPIADPHKCARIAALAAKAPQIAVVADHFRQVYWYAEAARKQNTRLRMLVDLDTGDHRTGVAHCDAVLDLMQSIQSNPDLDFQGIQAYSVKASHLPNADERAAWTTRALEPLATVKTLLESHGIVTPLLTGASTGSCAADCALPYLNEIQAGSYALMDGAYARAGIDYGPALTVLATVISSNAKDRVTVDAGFKAFSTDRPFAPDPVGVSGARYEWAGDEFGFVFFNRNQRAISAGDRIRFIPPHCDPTVNLYSKIYLVDGEEVVDTWPVMDRFRSTHD